MIKLQVKPQGPSTLFVKFKCECGTENTVEEHYDEWYDSGDGDSIHFYCQCRKFYKKLYKVYQTNNVLEDWYEEG